MRARHVGAALGLILSGACSLTSGLDGFSGGQGPAADGAAEVSEAGADGELEDGGQGDELAPEADGPPVCPEGGFCDDFNGGPLGKKWSFRFGDGGTFELDDSMSTSPPRSLHVRMNPGTAGVKRQLYLQEDLEEGVSAVRCSVRFRMAALPEVKDVTLLYFGIIHGTSSWYGTGVDIAGTYSGLWASGYLTDGGFDPGTYQAFGIVEPNRWYRLELVTDFQRATVSLDGVVVAEVTIRALARKKTEIVLGADLEQATGLSVHFDDLVCAITR